ncbi:MAG: hypothetical protein JWR30_251 [Conexibacter sp.]|jgi:hypothetical protein|nr:hypothetical protein [Conexibacter sp.]MDX6731942.1 hypothetical protein [Baekduia sp.]
MASSTRHAFRYEPSLCSLAEGETLGRRPADGAPEPRKHRSGLRARLSMRRTTGRERASR